jgi:hypothetical protein
MSGPERIWVWEDDGDPPLLQCLDAIYNPDPDPGDELYASLSSLTSEEAVERAARALFVRAEGGCLSASDWDSFDPAAKESFRDEARAAIAAAIGETDGKA